MRAIFLRCALALLLVQPAHAATYRLHPVQSGNVWSIIRIANLTDAAGSIEITGVDNTGERYGPVTLSMEPLATVLISTRQLERGAPEKGLYDGLGNGSGGWQLELTTDLEIGAVSFKSGPSSTVLGIAELISDEPAATLPPRFLWAHQLVDKGGNVRFFVGGTDTILAYRQGLHELLSAYDWSPYETYEGVELGWGDYESPTTGEMLKRFSGHLDYSAFAVQQPGRRTRLCHWAPGGMQLLRGFAGFAAARRHQMVGCGCVRDRGRQFWLRAYEL